MLATVTLIVSWIASFVFNPGSIGVLFTAIPIPFSAIATYTAATDMDMSVFSYRGRFQTGRYLGESSAAATWSFVALGFAAFDVFMWFLIVERFESGLEALAFVLCFFGGVFVLIGGILAKREWDE